MKKILLVAALLVLAGGPIVANAGPINIVAVVDESGSMSGEHAWLGTMIGQLDTKLTTLGFTGSYTLVGFGAANPAPRTLLANGTAGQFATATGNLLTSGGTEDGYAGLDYAFNLTYPGGPRNYILVTDEDRDNWNGNNLTFASISAALAAQSALLNVVVNNAFSCVGQTVLLGRQASTQDGFVADGFGDYTTCNPASIGSGFGTTSADYVAMAVAAWDLNQLRAGGLTAASFTEAFVDIKVQEIQAQVPEPASMLLLGSGLVGLAARLRRRK